MRVFSLNTVALALVVLSLAVPTGAVFGDHVGGENGIVLSPHAGPNGKYASINANGNLTIDLGDHVNADAVTTYDDVFDVTNNGSDHVRVWVTHNATDHVEFRTDASGSIQGEENGTVLAPDETVAVGLTVDTHDASTGTDLIDEMAIHARTVDPPTPSSPPSGGAGGGGGGGGGGGAAAVSTTTAPPTPTPAPPAETVVVSGSVRIAFEEDVGLDDTVRVDREDGPPDDPTSFGIRPEIVRTDPGYATANRSEGPPPGLERYGADSLAVPGQTVVLSGTGTLVDSPRAIAPGREPTAVYDIRVSPRLRDSRATIWMTIDRERFGDADPTEARVVRQRGDGWHLLETSLEEENATHVVLRARTPGFSRFAVLPRSDLRFRWSVDGRGTVVSEDVAVTYDEPGVYTTRLAVTDGLGRRNQTAYRLLVNDRPEVDVQVPGTVEAGEPVTLRAEVTDRFGETNVTWHFEDGREVRGRTVNRSFDGGEQVVTVRAVDEFGANATVEERFVVGRRGPVGRVVAFALGLQGRVALIALASLVVVGIVRWLVDRLGGDRKRGRP